jgi:ElaB/YqjD/DUF883 family membrane-anchored ribosome-binding protein
MTDFNTAGSKPAEQNSSQLSADLAGLRDDFAKLSSSVAELVKGQASQASAAMRGAVGEARERLASSTAEARDKLAGRAADAQGGVGGRAADAQDRFVATSADLEATIERNPLIPVLTALFLGVLIGALSRSRR